MSDHGSSRAGSRRRKPSRREPMRPSIPSGSCGKSDRLGITEARFDRLEGRCASWRRRASRYMPRFSAGHDKPARPRVPGKPPRQFSASRQAPRLPDLNTRAWKFRPKTWTLPLRRCDNFGACLVQRVSSMDEISGSACTTMMSKPQELGQSGCANRYSNDQAKLSPGN